MTVATCPPSTPAGLRIPTPTYQLLGAELLEAAEGRARVRFVPGLETANPAGLVQVASGALVPHVGLEAPLAHAAEVHAAMESRATLGKLVLTVRAATGNDVARSTRGAE